MQNREKYIIIALELILSKVKENINVDNKKLF
jgi:hypothetical protein